MSEKEQIKVKCEPVYPIYYNDSNNFGIYSCDLKDFNEQIEVDKENKFILVGIMPQLSLYRTYTVIVEPVWDKKYGRQYNFLSFENKKPDTTEEQRDYLETLLTENQVEEIFKVYDKPIDEIINDTFDYEKVKGLGAKTYPPLRDKIVENFVLYEILVELGRFGITFSEIKKIHDKYKTAELALQKINEDPFVLYRTLDGIGYKKNLKIAEKMGVLDKDDPRRVRAAIQYILEQNQDKGHTWIKYNNLKAQVYELIENYSIELKDYLNEYDEFYFDEVNDKCALSVAYNTEVSISRELMRIHSGSNILTIKKGDFNVDKFLEDEQKMLGIEYTDKQKQMFNNIFKDKINILNGGAGVGKTFTLNGILNMVDRLQINYALCSFSGKASKVMSEYTGRDASTIHRLLKWTPQGFRYNSNNKLPYHLIVVDEASQLDIRLFNSLIKAVDDNAIILFVLDLAQLEPIKEGNVLGDMISSNLFNICTLDKVFRQALDSGIVQICTKIRQGEKFITNKETGHKQYGKYNDTCLWFGNKDNSKKKIINSYKMMIERYGVDNVMVIVPGRKGEYGTNMLNIELQKIGNPPSDDKMEVKLKSKIFRENDRVMHIVNNYDAVWLNRNFEVSEKEEKGIFNGETGKIIKIEKESKNTYSVYVDYEDKIIKYNQYELKQIEHSFCCTVFKMQGSQVENVIFVFNNSHYIFAKRSLVYTAPSRAQKRLIGIVDPKMLNMAIDKNVIVKKRTFLKELLEDNGDKYGEYNKV